MSEERRAADRKIKEENLFKTLGAGEQEAETEGFQCGRCKQASRLVIACPFFPIDVLQAQVPLPSGTNAKCRRTNDDLCHVRISVSPSHLVAHFSRRADVSTVEIGS